MPPTIATRYLEISSIPLAIDGAWRITDYTPLLEEADQRGADRLVPKLAGRVAYQRRRDVSKRAVPIVILGIRNYDGVAHPDQVDGLEANILYLNTNVVAPTGTGDGTRPAVLHLPAGDRSANVHVLGLRLTRRAPTMARGVLELSIPTGRFA